MCVDWNRYGVELDVDADLEEDEDEHVRMYLNVDVNEDVDVAKAVDRLQMLPRTFIALVGSHTKCIKVPCPEPCRCQTRFSTGSYLALRAHLYRGEMCCGPPSRHPRTPLPFIHFRWLLVPSLVQL